MPRFAGQIIRQRRCIATLPRSRILTVASFVQKANA